MELETIGGGVLVLDNVECCAGGRGDRLTSQLLTLLDTWTCQRLLTSLGVPCVTRPASVTLWSLMTASHSVSDKVCVEELLY